MAEQHYGLLHFSVTVYLLGASISGYISQPGVADLKYLASLKPKPIWRINMRYWLNIHYWDKTKCVKHDANR